LETYENMLSFRTLNAYYPHLSLGPGQRFASKGGYLVHFADAGGTTVVKDGEWIVPESTAATVRAAAASAH
jgi:hypothetical protein